MGPEALAQVLRPLAGMFAQADFPDLLQGLTTPDDAAVWRLDGERALVMTSDFFPPVVDDPYDFGAIAAANALSDLYAMGAEPLFGINLVGFPGDLEHSILTEILRGGADKVREAGAAIAGGHTTVDAEPKYGLAVLGLVHPQRVWTKGGTRAGDAVYLTKPLGSGVVTTAAKRDAVQADDLGHAVASMSRLNARAAMLLRKQIRGVQGATDVTGFGLVGHGHEVADQSGLTLQIEWEKLPWLAGAERYVQLGFVPGGGRRNRDYFGRWIRATREMESWQLDLLCDPQTSGGLLFAVAASAATQVERVFAEHVEPLWRIGQTVSGESGTVEII